MARLDYIVLHLRNLIDKQCVKKTSFANYNNLYIFWHNHKKVFIGVMKMQNNTRNGFCNPQNPILEVSYIILWQVDPKLIFCLVSWRPSWIYANNKNCPKVAQGQPSWNSSRTLSDTNQQKNVIGKNISRSPKFQIDYRDPGEVMAPRLRIDNCLTRLNKSLIIYHMIVEVSQTNGTTFRLFVQQCVQCKSIENVKALHYWPFERGIHQPVVDSLTKGQ